MNAAACRHVWRSFPKICVWDWDWGPTQFESVLTFRTNKRNIHKGHKFTKRDKMEFPINSKTHSASASVMLFIPCKENHIYRKTPHLWICQPKNKSCAQRPGSSIWTWRLASLTAQYTTYIWSTLHTLHSKEWAVGLQPELWERLVCLVIISSGYK